MSTLDRPDPQTVSHEAVAAIARQRAAGLFEDVLLRDAKIQEQQAYIGQLEQRLAELESQTRGETKNGQAADSPQ